MLYEGKVLLLKRRVKEGGRLHVAITGVPENYGSFFSFFLLLVWSLALGGQGEKLIVLRRDREEIKRRKIDFLFYCVFAQALQQKAFVIVK